jgi:hypothetical protein
MRKSLHTIFKTGQVGCSAIEKLKSVWTFFQRRHDEGGQHDGTN